MAIITLTTDFGLNNYHTASLKGAIYSQVPDASIVDVSHTIKPFDVEEAAYVLKNCYQDFPEGTVHIIGVDSNANTKYKPIAVKFEGQYFITNDNGVISLIAGDRKVDKIIEIKINKYENVSFLIKDTFVPAACHLARGGELHILGDKKSKLTELKTIAPQENKEEGFILGTIVYVDNYGNSITNISEKQFNAFGKKRKFKIKARGKEFAKVLDRYSDIVEDWDNELKYHGEPFAIFNSSGFLQISMYKSNLQTVGGASSLLGLYTGTQVKVMFDK